MFGDVYGRARARGDMARMARIAERTAYRLPAAQVARGLSWLHRWMLAKGLPMQAEPAEPAFICELYARPRQ